MPYESETEGIRVMVQPRFSLALSDTLEGTYAFRYRVRLENRSMEVVRLVYRHWHIHDPGGEDSEVDGEGVVGEQPVLLPGSSHEYESFCVLHAPAGYMEGYYTFVRGDESEFRVAIPRFELEAPLPPPDPEEASELTN